MGIVAIVFAYICSVSFALVAITAGIVGWVVMPPIIHDMVIEGVVLENDTIQFERYETLPFPLHFKVHLFTITNPEEVQQGAEPVVNEIGPYVYNQYVTRRMINTDNETLEYYEEFRFEFNEELSAGSQDDEVTVLHAALNGFLQIAEIQLPLLLGFINTQVQNVFGVQTITVTTTVRQLLFDGVPFCTNGGVVCGLFADFDIPSIRPNDDPPGSFAFSFFHAKNSTQFGPFIINRGLQNSDELGEILLYRGATNLPYWLNYTDDEVSSCNMINGTNAAIYRPHLSENDILLVFNTDICRSVKLHFQREVTYKGIRGLRFVAEADMLDNSNRTCFCVNGVTGFHQEDGCLYDGALDLLGCQGSPIIATMPHMYLANDTYRNSVIGLTPDQENHEIFVEVDPVSGTILRGGKRIQFNMVLRPVPSITMTNNLKVSLTPILWVEEGVELPQEYVDELQSSLFDQLILVHVLTWTLLAGGAVIACGLLILAIFCTCRSKKRFLKTA